MTRNGSYLRGTIAALLGAAAFFALSAAGGIGNVGAACAQVPTVPGVPTLGPVDPACQRVPDTDNDGVWDYDDNCHRYYNPSQKDIDNDAGPKPYEPVPVTERDPMTGGDACDIDDDGDTLRDVKDVCPKVPDKDQKDTDGDGVGDACDPTPTVPNQVAGAPVPKPAGVPKLTVRGLARTQHLAELQAGLAVPARCSAPCTITAQLTADRAIAKRLGVKQGTTISTTTAGLADAGNTYLFLRLSKTVRARLAKMRHVSLSVRAIASDDVGHKSTFTTRVRVLR